MTHLVADYRKIPRALSKVYFDPLTAGVHAELNKLFDALTSSDPISTTIVRDRKLPIWGRTLDVPESSGAVARFDFSDLCDRPLSAADYLQVASTFPTIFVQDVPRLGLGERDQARRFITFIDGQPYCLLYLICTLTPVACYENRTKLFISSEVPIQQIFSDDKSKNVADDAHMRASTSIGLTLRPKSV
jgi:protein AFG1